jgi:hypothetical protein
MKTKLVKVLTTNLQTHDGISYSALVLQLEHMNEFNKFYSYNEVAMAIESFKTKINKTGIYGELSPIIKEEIDTDISKISHSITDISIIENEYVRVTINTLRTPNGIILKKMLDDDICIFLKMKGYGRVNNAGVVTELDFYTFDADLMQNLNSFESVRVSLS